MKGSTRASVAKTTAYAFAPTKRMVSGQNKKQAFSRNLTSMSLKQQANRKTSSGFFGTSLAVGTHTATSVRRSRAGKVVTKAMFERFTEKAIKVVMLAQEEVRDNFSGAFLFERKFLKRKKKKTRERESRDRCVRHVNDETIPFLCLLFSPFLFHS